MRRVSLLSLLLRLLISLCLIAHASVSAWASVGMIPMIVGPSMHVAAVSRSCHDTGASGVLSATHLNHGRSAPPTPCGKLGHCGCLQHSHFLLVSVLDVPVPLWRRMAPLASLPVTRGLPAPYRPIRPPIA
ncbi:MAG TPA: CopL family metal-binding regulatory protein [Xylella sp.]